MTLVEALQTAAKEQVGIIVTEHWDYDYPTNPYAFLFDLDDYFRKFSAYRSEQVLLGIEIGMHDPYHFSKQFKQVVGMAPTAYLKHVGWNNNNKKE